jgi:hypothetical protein
MKTFALIATLTVGIYFLLSLKDSPDAEMNDQTDYSYCKPDEDPAFALNREDDLYYYYSGEKVIRGTIYQTHANSPITFESGINQSCKFELTKNNQINWQQLNEDFSYQKAWENAPQCNEFEGDPYLSGRYKLKITDFKISKSYIDNYDPQRIRDQMAMSRFEFTADYDNVVEEIVQAEVKCPVVLR